MRSLRACWRDACRGARSAERLSPTIARAWCLLNASRNARLGGACVVEAAHDDGADHGRRERCSGDAVEGGPVHQARVGRAGLEARPQARHQPQAGRVGGGWGCRLEGLRPQGGGRQVLDRPQGRGAEAGGGRGGAEVVRGVRLLHGRGDGGEQQGEADVLRHRRAAVGKQPGGGDAPGQLVGQHELDGHVAGLGEDRAAQPHAEEVVRDEHRNGAERVVGAEGPDRGLEGGAEVQGHARGLTRHFPSSTAASRSPTVSNRVPSSSAVGASS